MKITDLAQFNLPDTPGVYFFKRGKSILYIGKATSLKDRVKSYFARDILLTRGPRIEKMLELAEKVEYVETDSVLEALLLEAYEIKKHQPVYNAREKDDKSYNFVVATKEDFPRIILVRGRDLNFGLPLEALAKWGPFPHGGELREALKIIRKIFPYRDAKCKILPAGKLRPCFNAQIGLCPGPCGGWITKKDYAKTIRNISLFFEAKKTRLVTTLEKEMKALAKEQKFEEAEKIKRQLFALDHIQDVALIKADVARGNFDSLTLSTGAPTELEISFGPFRIEAYDIAHMSGKDVVGVMTVVEDGELNKSQYRKFKIKDDKNDDTNNLKEVLTRRLNHPEWPMPSMIAVDGGVGQINAAKSVLKERGLDIEVVSVVKDDRHKARGIMGKKGVHEKAILLANAEAHRFAIGYHRKLRGKGFRI